MSDRTKSVPPPQRGRSPGLAERFARLKRGKRVADALVQVADQAGESPGLFRLLERICGLTVESMPVDRCTIYLWSARRRVYVLAADCGPPAHPVAREGHHHPRRVRFQEEFAAEQMIVLCRDHRMSAERFDMLEEAGLYSLAVVPLRGRVGTMGAMTVGLQRSPGFDEEALETLRGVARHTATLIENAQLRARLHKAAAVRGKLAELAVRLGSRNDPEAIGRLASAEGAALFGVSGGVMLLREGDALLPCGSSDDGATALAGLRLSLSERDRPTVQAFHGQRPIVVSDFVATASDDDRRRHRELKCMLAVPLVGRAGSIGCLVYADRHRTHRFSAESAADGVLLGAIVAAALEHVQTIEDAFRANAVLRESERLRAGHDRILELLATGGGVAEALDDLLRSLEAQMPGMLCSVLVLDEQGQRLRHVAAPSLPRDYVLALDAMAVGPRKGSCGAAAYAGRRIIVEDVVTDARWVALRTVAISHGIRACWAQPVQRAPGPLVGIFAVHYHEARGPTPAEVQLVEAAAPLVAIALERVRNDEERQRHIAQVEDARVRADERARHREQEAIELLHARDQALAANRASLSLLADVTHELRTRAALSESLGGPGAAEWSREIAGPGRCSDLREPEAPIEVESTGLEIRREVESGAGAALAHVWESLAGREGGALAHATDALERSCWTMGTGAIGALRWGIQHLRQVSVLAATRDTLARAEEELRHVQAVVDARRRRALSRDP